jgi:hypothetical protein
MFADQEPGIIWYFFYTGMIQGYAERLLSEGINEPWTLDQNLTKCDVFFVEDGLNDVLYGELSTLRQLLAKRGVVDFELGAAIRIESEGQFDVELYSTLIESDSGGFRPDFLGFEVSARGFFSGVLNVCGMDLFNGQVAHLNEYGLFPTIQSANSFQSFLTDYIEDEGPFSVFALWKI